MKNKKQYTKEELYKAFNKVFKEHKPYEFRIQTSLKVLKEFERLFKEHFNK